MKIKIFVLLLIFAINTFPQDIIKKVYTDKTIYIYGETVVITIRAINTSAVQDTIVFPNSCEAYPFIDNNNYLHTFGRGCYESYSERIIPAHDSIEWVYQYPHPSEPMSFLSIGQHNVFGHFQQIFFFPDAFIISNTDTINIFVNEDPSTVSDETNKYIYSLEQNYPNPFNPATSISFTLMEKSYTTLKVYDTQGKEIAVLVNDELNAGTYYKNWDASGFSSGVYFYRLETGQFCETKKLVLLK